MERFWLVLLVIFMISACGTSGSFKTARLASANKFDLTAGVIVQNTKLKKNTEDMLSGNTLSVDNTDYVIYRQDFSVSRRIGGSSSKWDFSANFALVPWPFPNVVIRRNFLSQQGWLPETTIGFVFRQFLRSISDGLPYSKETESNIPEWNGNTDFGIPIYNSWLLHGSKQNELFTVILPYYRTGDYRVDSIAGLGLQVNVGMRIKNFIPEVGINNTLGQGIHFQGGIAYKF